MTYIGANVGGMADGPATGNTEWTDYNVPDPNVILNAGLNIARVGFKSERFYQAANYVQILMNVAKPLVAAKVMVVLDPHDFGSTWNPATSGWNGIGSAPGTALFLKLMTDLAAAVKAAALDQGYVCIGLQNEPGTPLTDAGFMATCWQPAVNALRAAGFTGWIEVPVNGSQEAYKVSVATPYGANVSDPLNRTVLGVHGYGDASNEGLGDASANATEMAGRFAGPIAWFRASGAKQGFAGIAASEFGTSSADAVSQADFAAVVKEFMSAPDAMFSATAWTMDPWLGNNGNYLGTAAAPTANLVDLENAETPLVVYLAGDAYQGPAVADLTVDGKTLVSGLAVTATRTGAPQAVRLPGTLSPGQHQVRVTFEADAWGGTPTTDRNLYVVAITYAGQLVTGCPNDFVALPNAGSHTATISVPS